MQFRAGKLTVAVLTVLALTAGTAVAQSRAAAILEYFDDELEIQILDAENFEYNNIYMGMELLPGDTVKTFASTAELRLERNGSIIKLAPETELTVERLEGRNGASTNVFSLLVGRLRAIAARAAGTRYEFRTPSAVAGVRGTDFGLEVVPDSRSALFVREGSVSYRSNQTGEEIVVEAGEAADVFGESFEPVALSPAEMQERFEGLEFEDLNPDLVPQAALGDELTPTGETAGPADGSEPGAEGEPTTEPDEEPAPEAEGPEEPPVSEETAFSRAMERIGEVVGLESGAVTVGGETYAKLVVQPTFAVGDLEAALYLPAVYQRNLFDPTTYYRPKGNNEWSFGSDQDWEEEPLEATADLFTDLALKLRYLRYGERRDPLYLRLGNLSSMTLGHGLLMRNYANDVDFPAVRRIGFNGGVDTGGFGFETAVNDLTEPEIVGARVFFRPLQRTAALGLSAVADFDPAGDIPTDGSFGEPTGSLAREVRRIDPVVATVGADVDVSLVETDLLSLVAFTDIGGLMPYLRDSFVDVDGEKVEAGLRTEAFIDTEAGQLHNFGAMTGVLGNVSFLDYRLDFRTYNGLFRPSFFDRSYERRRSEVATGVVAYLSNPGADEFDRTGAGVYGEAGVNLFGGNFRFVAGYLWPWEIDDAGDWLLSDFDYLTLRAELKEGLLPLGIHASAEYERRGFFATALDRGDFEDATFFDANSVVRSEMVYPVAETLDLAVVVTTTVLRNTDGSIRYEDGRPELSNSVTIETRIGL